MKHTGFRHRLLSILAADVAGYSRLMSDDGRATVEALDVSRGVFRRCIESHEGRVIDMAGDSVLAAFETAAGAVSAAIMVQRRLASLAHDIPETRRMRFRIGIHLGDLIQKHDGTVYGDGVNIAARLQALVEPGGIAVSCAVHEAVAMKIDASFEDIGEQSVKNISKPVRAFLIRACRRHHFGRYEVQSLERRLLLDGKPIAIGAPAFDVLLALAERPGRLVTRNELLRQIGEHNVTTQVGVLRRLLSPELIATIPGRGYRFTATPNDPARYVRVASPVPNPPRPPELKTNLPDTLPPLIGRDADLAAVVSLICEHRLVTIIGAGGVGKTRLAQALLDARRNAYAHGVCWVELGSINSPSALAGAIAAALGVRIGSGDPLAGLVAATASLAVLIALDNAEHLVADVARVVEALHLNASQIHLVVTSQAPLKANGERLYRLGALALPDGDTTAELAATYGAIALFVDRAKALDQDFTLTDGNVGEVVALCRSLDGLALAIELAAARLPLLGLSRLAVSLDRRLRLLKSGTRSAPARQQTLRSALEWSHGLLSREERTVFRRLAVVAGSASLELVQQVATDECLDEWSVLDALGGLVDRSLVVVSQTEPPRYRLLDSPRAYALEQLAAAGELNALRRRHAQAVAARFDSAWDDGWSGLVALKAWELELEPDFDNAREAFAWAHGQGDAATALAIAPTLLRVLPGSLQAERFALAEACEGLIRLDASVRLRLRAWLALAYTWTNTRPQRSHAAATHAIQLARESGDRFGLYYALCRYAQSAPRLGDDAAAETALQEMRAIRDPSWPPHRLWPGAEAESFCARMLDDPTAAPRYAREELRLVSAAGLSNLGSMSNLVDAELAAGEQEAAVSTGIELLGQLHGTRQEDSLAYARLNLAAAWLALGNSEQARMLALAGWPQAKRFDMQPYWADYLALLAALEGRPRAASQLAGYAENGYARHEDRRQPNEAHAADHAATIARTALGDEEFERLKADGVFLRDDEVERVAFGMSDV